MLTERPTPTPAFFEQVLEKSSLVAENLRNQANIYGQRMNEIWDNFHPHLTKSRSGWLISPSQYSIFYKQVGSALQSIDTKDVTNAIQPVLDHAQDDTISHELFYVVDIMNHDLFHLEQSISPLNLLSWLKLKTQAYHNKNVVIPNRHKDFLNLAIPKSSQLAHVLAFLPEYLQGLINLEQDRTLVNRPVNLIQLFETISFLLKQRFLVEDYEILVNPPVDQSRQSNKIIISGPDGLTININEAMLFGIIYNLAKNAGKAIQSQNLSDIPMKPTIAMKEVVKRNYRYVAGRSRIEPANPMEIFLHCEESDNHVIIEVGDSGPGLSVDNFINKIRGHIKTGLETMTPEELRQTDWFWQLRKQVGGQQAEFIMAWPTDPNAFRNIQMGTVIDAQFFYRGFSGEDRGIRDITSGIGLPAVNYLTGRLGATVIGTNKFDGGALFTIILPKNR